MAEIDHLIMFVNERETSVAFLTDMLGFTHEGEREPFSIVRVSATFQLQLAAWGTKGGEHYAFAMSRPDFNATFERVRAAGIPYGDRFDTVGNMQGPGDEPGARGMGKIVYFFDPNKHLIEIRTYAI